MAEVSTVLTQNPPKAVVSIPSVCDDTISPDDYLFPQPEDIMPIIDYTMLLSDDPQLHSKAVQDLGKACEQYGYFSVINHDVPEYVMKGAIEGLFKFFDLSPEEKKEYAPKNSEDRIRWGRGYNPDDHVVVKREYLKIMRYDPQFQFPSKPPGLSEVLKEFHASLRRMAVRLLRGMSEHLGLEETHIEKVMKLDSGVDLAGANLYPAEQETDSLMGQPAHYDPGFITLFIQNTPGGLQLQHQGKWLKANIPNNSIFINLGDHIEIFTNGKYKSLVHRVVVSNKVRRISAGQLIGPPLDVLVCPAQEFVDELHPPSYQALTYRDYLQYYNYDPIDVKSCLTKIRL